MNRYFIWYLMFLKRLLCKISFIVLLCLIPVITLLGNTSMSEDSGVLTIALSAEDDDELSMKIINKLTEKDSILLFKKYSDNAVTAVEKHEADAAWIFKSDLSERIDKYTSKKSLAPFVDIYEREDSTPLKISHEVLYEALYESISYSLYGNYVKKELVPNISEDELQKFYDSERLNDIIKITQLNSPESKKVSNYLTAPLRGFLALLIVLCALAAAMYFLEDNSCGKYDKLPCKKRIIPAFALCLASVTLSSAAVFAALSISGIASNFARELLTLVLFDFSAVGFALFFCTVFRSPAKLGACIPGIIIVMLVLSPIFFNFQILKPIRLLLPTFYYIYSVKDTAYIFYMIIYIISVYTAVFTINSVVKHRR